MSSTPATTVEPEDWGPYLNRAGMYLALLVLVLLATPGPTASMLGWLLAMVSCPVEVHGSSLLVGEVRHLTVTPLWSAAPIVALGASLILAHRATLRQQVGGVALVAINSVGVNLLVLGLLVQAPSPQVNQLADALRWAYPLMMGVVLLVTVVYWAWRVVYASQKVQAD